MNFPIMIPAVVKSFGWSTLLKDKRRGENSFNSNGEFRYYLQGITNKYFKDEYGHGEMI